MDTVRTTKADVSAAEPIKDAHWDEIGTEVTARLKAITRNVKRVLAQEGLSDVDVEYDKSANNQA